MPRTVLEKPFRRMLAGLAAPVTLLCITAVYSGQEVLHGGSMSMTAEATRTAANKATAQRWSEDLWGQGKLSVADEIIAPNYVRHDPGDPFPARGPEDVKRIISMLRQMLPDLRIHVEAVIAEDDFVVSRYTSTATDTVGFMGHPPTGRVIHTSAMQMFRFENGKIAESWAVRDDLGTLRQLGHVPMAAGR
jgi:steroid delta-isomerase-like uncharacterized protein